MKNQNRFKMPAKIAKKKLPNGLSLGKIHATMMVQHNQVTQDLRSIMPDIPDCPKCGSKNFDSIDCTDCGYQDLS